MAITRAGAQTGDVLCVTGPLGGSLLPGPQGQPPHHLAFTPRVDAALALAQAFGGDLHAMMDLSDGLAMDAPHLAQASGVDLEVDLDALPVRTVAQQAHPAPEARWRSALGDGEDYELLLALAPDASPRAALPPDVTLTAIGRVVAPSSPPGRVAWLTPDGRPFDTAGLGWEHAAP
ncbi:MAG: AIR synthase-related protein [Planctomycetota bacterium]